MLWVRVIIPKKYYIVIPAGSPALDPYNQLIFIMYFMLIGCISSRPNRFIKMGRWEVAKSNQWRALVDALRTHSYQDIIALSPAVQTMQQLLAP